MAGELLVLKCGCVFDGKEFTKYCREHGLKLLQKRWEKATQRGGEANGG